MAMLVARPVDALQQSMAGLTPVVNGKRKAPSPLPSGVSHMSYPILHRYLVQSHAACISSVIDENACAFKALIPL